MPVSQPFVDWFKDVCRHAGMVDAQPAVDAGALLFGDIAIAVNTSLVASGADLLFQAPLGRLPQREAEPILRRLFEVQLLMAGPVAPTFGVALGSDIVVASLTVRPSDVSAESAARALGGLVYLVKSLRGALRLEPTVPNSKVPA